MITRFLDEESPDNNKKLNIENIEAWSNFLETYTTPSSRA
jgi:hypothetical protein